MGYSKDSPVKDILGDPQARRLVEQALPGVLNSPMATQLTGFPVGALVAHSPAIQDDEQALSALWEGLAALDGSPALRAHRPFPQPAQHYEDASVPLGSATVSHTGSGRAREPYEVQLDGPTHGNPFVDVEVSATFTCGEREVVVGGFYDGRGRYLVRLLPETAGAWSFRTSSTARSLDGIVGTFTVEGAAEGQHGPVHVDGFHFRHDDGTRHTPLGTTAYAWIHQGADVREATLRTLERAPFTKLRMCVFPKSYLYNSNEPELYPYPRGEDGQWDFTRFEPAFFAHLEESIRQLGQRGIEADVILFHAYDRWGFSDMGAAADDHYVRYLVRRLAALPNVWWSMANEYDLLWAKTEDDWERMAALVVKEDPVGHLLSIHNCGPFYDYTRKWITHSSVQRIDVYRTAENVDEWRRQWGKPVVVDECAYEGDLDQGWGNISGQEMVRRFWEGAVRGGYVGHGETYYRDDEQIWWAKGGQLTGESPERIAFLRRILEQAPDGVLDPLPSDWDVPWAGVAQQQYLLYFGFGRPRFRSLVLPPGNAYYVDVIDTWNMTVQRLPETVQGACRVPLPGREFIALRLTRA
ncbi:DUF5605 domain-containing protein [Kineococcus auxinigenes]|uniref:DUF5605 domain-containing protein n=1 Tax=unclassified Kineococcus TaxID=2621656 RepID=UPI003D7DB195